MTRTNRTLWITMLLIFTMMVPGFARESVDVNKSTEIAANPSFGQILDVDLTTERTTRVQILVKNKDQICQNHMLTVGPKGVVDGEHRGAVEWGYELPPETDASHVEVLIMVQGFAGNGSPVSYDLKAKTEELNLGFGFQRDK